MRRFFIHYVLVFCALLTFPARASSFIEVDRWLDEGLDREDVLTLQPKTARLGYHRAAFAVSVASFVTQRDIPFEGSHSTAWGLAVTVSIPTSLGEPPRERAPPRTPILLPPGFARRCVNAAWTAAGIGNDKKLDGMAARARASAALPEVRLRASRGIDAQARVDTDYDSEKYADTSSTNLWLEARLTWRLDRAVFADEELQVERLLHDRRELRLKIAHKVLEALSHWLRASNDIVNAIDHESRSKAHLRLLEAEVALDALTDGWFGSASPTRHQH